MSDTEAARIRRKLNHPVIDADGHWLELQSVFREYLAEIAGPSMVDRYAKSDATANWYDMGKAERDAGRHKKPGWWAATGETMARAAGNMPALFHERLDDWGIDVALVYPTFGLRVTSPRDEEVRRALTRAYNAMLADMFGPYSDRLIPAAVVPMNTPQEAIEAITHARGLGLKLMVMNGAITRTIEADAAWRPDPAKRRTYIDCLGLDSPYDYDPVWKKCVEAGVAVTNHEGSFMWPNHSSLTNHVMNHLGHFAEGNHYFARGLFMGGVTERHPTLTFGFLEGGVSWACQLQADLLGHWEKRNKSFMHKHLNPGNIDVKQMFQVFEEQAKNNAKLAAVLPILSQGKMDYHEVNVTLKQMAERDAATDDFANVNVNGPEDIRRLFAKNFYFGCEADDPFTALAFDTKYGPTLKPVLGSDISHWDVPDASEVMVEAWELVEDGMLTEEQFREFTFTNSVHLHAGMNADFFKGTIIEAEAKRELGSPPDGKELREREGAKTAA